MKKYSDFAEEKILDGDKIKIDDVLNKEIKITGHSIKISKYSKNKNGDYLTLQIELDNEKYIIFTGSDVLIDQLKKYNSEIPFLATIRKINKYYSLM